MRGGKGEGIDTARAALFSLYIHAHTQQQEGRLVAMGSPKQVPLESTLPSLLVKAVAAAPAEQQPQQSFTLDEDF